MDKYAAPRKIDQSIRAAMQACITHSRNLIASARAVRVAGHSNIAYHLATLALEEIGKRDLFLAQSIADQRSVPNTRLSKYTQDHTKKLFWSLFGAEFHSGTLTKETFAQIQSVAISIHANRLAGLYVDLSDDGLIIPDAEIDSAACDNLIGLAEARLGIAESSSVRETIPAEDVELQSWFLKATDDPEARREILSQKSLEKFGELKDSRAWMNWLKGLFDEAEAAGAEAAARELERSRDLPASGTKDKWRIRVRILCASHSIRPKALKIWNDKVGFISLQAVSGKKNQLLIELTLKNHVPVEALWPFGWDVARHFVVALNIGTMGFWWWRMPEQVSGYYEAVVDLESPKMRLQIERVPSLKIDWSENLALTEEDMLRVMECFAALPSPSRLSEHEAYNYYIGGLTFLSLNDIHWQCELQAFGNFMASLKAMMKDSGVINEKGSFENAFFHLLDELFPGMDERTRYAQMLRNFESEKWDDANIQLKEVAFIKLFCDAYFLCRIRPKALARLKTEIEK